MATLHQLPQRRAIGTIGDWFARVDGERLPCVHRFWWENGRSPTYNDTELRSSPKADELFEAIKRLKRVILTFHKGSEGVDERGGYIAIYAVDDVEFDANGLRFKFKERLVDLFVRSDMPTG